jgi:hypothetical protein
MKITGGKGVGIGFQFNSMFLAYSEIDVIYDPVGKIRGALNSRIRGSRAY